MLIKSTARVILPLRRYFSRQKIDYTKDYYKILNVAEDADTKTIKQQFYTLAKEHHPDKAEGKNEQFAKINDAYAILGDEQMRRQYDQRRNRSRSEDENQAQGKEQNQHYNLNYEPYSKTSRLKWAVYRKGWRKDQITHHYNYQENIIAGEMGSIAAERAEQHWKLALQLVTHKQIQEDKHLRKILQQKEEEAARDYLIRKDKLIDQEIENIRNKLDNHFIGKRIRFIFDYLVKKTPQEEQWSQFLRREEKKINNKQQK